MHPSPAMAVEPGYRRINERLQEYWVGLRGARKFPPESDVQPAALSDIWDYCFLIRLPDDAQIYQYVYLGKALMEAFGDDLSAVRDVSEYLLNPASRSLMRGVEQVLRTGEPAIEDGKFSTARGLIVKYRSSLLPLGEQDGTVRYVLGGMKWKVF